MSSPSITNRPFTLGRVRPDMRMKGRTSDGVVELNILRHADHMAITTMPYYLVSKNERDHLHVLVDAHWTYQSVLFKGKQF